MICLKNKLILFFLAFIATSEVCNAVRLEHLTAAVESFEPVVIEYAVEVEDDNPVYHKEAAEVIHPRITVLWMMTHSR